MMSAALQGAPISQQPISQQPITQQPISQQPISQMPISQMPLQAPITQQPISQQPISQQPISQQELTSFATSASPITQHPITQHGLDSGLGDLKLADILSVGQPVTCAGARYGSPSALGEISPTGLPTSIVTATGDVNLSAAFCAGHIASSRDARHARRRGRPRRIHARRHRLVREPDRERPRPASSAPTRHNYTIADLIAIMVNRQVLDWENLDPRRAQLLRHEPRRQSPSGRPMPRSRPTGRLRQRRPDGEDQAAARLPLRHRASSTSRAATRQSPTAAPTAATSSSTTSANRTTGLRSRRRRTADGPVQTLTFTIPNASSTSSYTVRVRHARRLRPRADAGEGDGQRRPESPTPSPPRRSASPIRGKRSRTARVPTRTTARSARRSLDERNTEVEESYIGAQGRRRLLHALRRARGRAGDRAHDEPQPPTSTSR